VEKQNFAVHLSVLTGESIYMYGILRLMLYNVNLSQ
jgi:hypothetical protein